MTNHYKSVFDNSKSIAKSFGKDVAYDYLIAVSEYDINGIVKDFDDTLIDFIFKNTIKNMKSGADKKKAEPVKVPTVFEIPTLEEVKAYIEEKKFCVNAEYFYSYYDERSWKYNTGCPVKDWKKCLVRWNINAKNRNNPITNKISESDIDSFFNMVENR